MNAAELTKSRFFYFSDMLSWQKGIHQQINALLVNSYLTIKLVANKIMPDFRLKTYLDAISVLP